ncbi:MAG TPA: TonB-dependent receptor, partial [Verrucomicrobiota bacterium]|nr:TonB-dependent receptor [Verrucomicrobiota bacterium]
QGKAPTKTAVIDATKIIQWSLYYPAVVDPAEINFSDAERAALSDSLEAYRSGDLLQALARYPENRSPGSDAERVYYSALLLSVGRVNEVEATLGKADANLPTARALREVIAVVLNEDPGPLSPPTTASEFIARSYTLQSRSQLTEALAAARSAVNKSTQFGAAYVRVAELEFGFGRVSEAKAALDDGLKLSPRNAQGIALEGFLLSAKNKLTQASEAFERAIAADGNLGNAWLGRGLVKMRRGHTKDGLKDLEVAAAVEPQRAVLRSYLGKGFAEAHDTKRAMKELELAKKLDPNDPTSWLYSALLNQEENRINDAIGDLERSKELNDNRSIFRSRLLLDQDDAVRSANLASMYRDAGMFEVGVQEASRAVDLDYANASAHLFLASSYESLRDPKLRNLRYETPAFSEYLMANLLAPPGAGLLSQTISQQEYSRFFAEDGFGLSSSTTYGSGGDWAQAASQYGTFGNTSYSLDVNYLTENGQRPNNDLEYTSLAARFKQQITDSDSLMLEISTLDYDSGDVSQYYDQDQASTTLRVKETQEPNVLLGYNHRWSPGVHTLVLGTRLDDELKLRDSNPNNLWLRTFVNLFNPGVTNVSIQNPAGDLDYKRQLTFYSAEVQHIIQNSRNTIVFGGRYQTARADTDNNLVMYDFLGNPMAPIPQQDFDSDIYRWSLYAYDYWQLLDTLQLVGGVSYDYMHYPRNIDTSPITDDETSKDQISPKVGLTWTPAERTAVRGIYTRSLGGTFFDSSVRLEPTQIAGFNQAFRSIAPESVIGLVPGSSFETFGLGLNQTFKTRTYVLVEGQLLTSDGSRTVGILTNSNVFAPIPDGASGTRQSVDYNEWSLLVTVNQLLGRDFAVGARYRLTYADMDTDSTQIDSSVPGSDSLNQDVHATLSQLRLYGIFNHPCGFFFTAEGVWSWQDSGGY